MDSVSNFLNKLKLASRVRKESFVFPASRFIAAIAAALQRTGYIAAVAKRGKRGQLVEVRLAYQNSVPKVMGVKRVSRLSKRVYRAARDIRPVRNGYGALILSTPKGIVTGAEARTARVGGEVLFEIW